MFLVENGIWHDAERQAGDSHFVTNGRGFFPCRRYSRAQYRRRLTARERDNGLTGRRVEQNERGYDEARTPQRIADGNGLVNDRIDGLANLVNRAAFACSQR